MTKKLQNYINGEWVDSESGKFTDVINPATQEVLASCPDSTKAEGSLL